MEVNGKESVSFALNCPFLCGGLVENEILFYLTCDNELIIYGRCGECEQHGYLTIPLIELMSNCPTLTVQ